MHPWPHPHPSLRTCLYGVPLRCTTLCTRLLDCHSRGASAQSPIHMRWEHVVPPVTPRVHKCRPYAMPLLTCILSASVCTETKGKSDQVDHFKRFGIKIREEREPAVSAPTAPSDASGGPLTPGRTDNALRGPHHPIVFGGRGGAGTCFNFHSNGGGDPSPLDPLPPSPLSSSAAENLGFGNFFW